MIVLVVERVPKRLRGELTRWLLEPRTGVYVGDVSALVRDKLWSKVCQECKGGGAVLVHSAANEQGFALRVWGLEDREIADFDGLALVRVLGATEPETS